MTAGDILREALLVVEKVTVKSNEDIELGELIYNDGNGFLAMPNTATAAKAYVALEAHDYSEVSYHDIRAAVIGKVTVQKVTGAIKEGDIVCISTTDGAVTKFVKGDAPTGGVSTYYTTTIETGVQTALDTNLTKVGTCAADAASGDATVDIWLGVY